MLLGTSAYPPLLRSVRRYVAPVYDYVLVSEPLSAEQRAAIGWERRQGLGDGANQFHYYRLTADDRILFGGYDAVYRFGGPVGGAPRRARRDASPSSRSTSSRPSRSSRACASPTAGAERSTRAAASRCSSAPRTTVASRTSTGYTGLGVGATRFGARVALDLLDGRESEATRLALRAQEAAAVPARAAALGAAIQLTRNRLAAADRNDGRRGLWLRTLDRLGLGFDS